MNDRNEEDQKVLDDHVFDFGDYFGYDDLPETDEELRHLFSIIDCNAIGLIIETLVKHIRQTVLSLFKTKLFNYLS